MNKTMWFSVLAVLLVAPLSLQAAVFKSGQDVALNDASSDDAFLSGNNIAVTKEVNGDLFTAGQSITISGQANEDVYAAGQNIRITSPVKQDVLTAGQTISITAPEVEHVYAAGQSIEIGPDTTVQRNVYVAGQTIDIAGTINGSVYATGDTIRIKSGTVIKGDLHTYGNKAPVIEDKATVQGQTINTSPTPTAPAQRNQAQSGVLNWLRSVISWFIVSLLALYLVPVFAQTVVSTAVRTSGRSLLTGFIWLLVFVPAIILLLITVVGIPVALIVLFLSLVLIILGMAYAPIIIGSWVMARLSPQTSPTLTWQHVLLGVVINEILWIIPVLGSLISFVIFILSLGALILTLWRNLRSETLDTPITPVA